MPRALIIDDDPQVRTSIRKALLKKGFEVDEAENGATGMMRISPDSLPDLVITDLIMPEKEGLELIMTLRESHPTLPVIAISGHAQAGSGRFLDMASCLGAHSVLTKPFSLDELWQSVEAALALA